MSGNRLEITRTRAQGVPLIVLEIRGDDVVGHARVYYSLDQARGVQDVLGEEIIIAEAESR